MFDGVDGGERADQLEQSVLAKEAEICRLRAEQIRDLRELDRYQIDTADGARTMGDWVASHLDLSHQTSSRLMTVANANDPEVDQALATGTWGLDRAALLVKLRQAGTTPQLFSEAAAKYSLGRLFGLLDRVRHLTPADEQDLFEYRYLVVQPNLDESAFKLWGQLPSSTGREARGRWLGEQASRAGGGCQTRPKRRGQLHHPPPSHRLTAASHLPRRSAPVEEKCSSTPPWLPNLSVRRESPSPRDPESDQTPFPRFSAPAKSGSSSPTATSRSPTPILGKPSHPLSDHLFSGGTKAYVQSRAAAAATASNPTTSTNANTTAATIPTTSSPSAGTTTT
jgi:hypothetical protein